MMPLSAKYVILALVINGFLVTSSKGDDLVTQTVYGFLDFTTTIGNTVMVFSPQSSPAPEPTKPLTAPSVVNVIETKPSREGSKAKEIHPTKTASKVSKQKLSSVVHVVAGPPISNSPRAEILASKVEVVTSVKNTLESHPSEKKKFSSKITVKEGSPIVVNPVVTKVNEVISKPVYSSIVEVRADSEPEQVVQIGNNLAEPEYDFLSRQPSEFAEETYRVINLKPSGKLQPKTRSTQHSRRTQTPSVKDTHPTGLVTKLSGTVVKDGVTTVHETSVLGTYISGKYAQVLQSSSQVYRNNKPRISPSSTLRILKTAAPTTPVNRHSIDPTPANGEDSAPLPGDSHPGVSGPNHIRASRRPATSSGSFKNRFRSKNSKDDVEPEQRESPPVSNSTPQSSVKKSRTRSKPKNRRYSRNSSTASVELATVSVYTKMSTPSYSSRRNKARNPSFKATTNTPPPTTETNFQLRRGFKPKVQPAAVAEADQQTSLYKFKLNRAPGRWQYKTSPKPRVTIRKATGDENVAVTPPSPTADVTSNDIPSANARSDDNDLESSGSINGAVLNEAETGNNGIEKRYPVETLNVEISTPADFKETYYEIATIKSPYTFQVGTVKNTRYITVTSTFEKTLEPEPTAFPSTLSGPLTENILASTTYPEKEQNLLDSSIATLPALYLSSEGETPPLETMTETFSTTQNILKTHILPIIREGENASSITLIQTYHITRLVTATKTLPPMDAYQFIPSKRLKEFNTKLDEAGSELHLELEFGDENDDDEDVSIVKRLPPDLDLANVGSDLDIFNINKLKGDGESQRPVKKVQKVQREETQNSQNLSPEQLQQIALLRLLNPAAAAQLPQFITTSKPVIKFETLYESHVIPIVNGQLTSFSTISRPLGTVSKTEFEIGTSTFAPLQIPQVPVNPLFPQPQPQFQITTAPIVTQTVVTQTNSKILKLTFGAKTAYTTLFSTNVVPTILTTFVTTSVAVQPTAAFPGYFPAPYPPYPFG